MDPRQDKNMCLTDDVKQLRMKIKKDGIKRNEIIQLAEEMDINYDTRRKRI